MIELAVAGVDADELLDELTAALAAERDGNVIRWRPADWQPDAQAELAVRDEGGRVVLELRGLDELLGSELAGWVADLVAAATSERLGDWLTDRYARRPRGARARGNYRDPLYHRPSFGAVLEALELRADDVLLEVGCGGGAFLAQALARGCEAKAVDHSEEMVRLACEANPGAEIVRASADALPFADAEFTAAAMMQVFFFLDDPRAALRECARVLRPGGRLAVFTITEELRGTPASPEPMASRSRFYSRDELVGLAREAGFAEATVTRPDLERHARAAGLPEDVVPMFAGNGGQLLVARR